MLKNISNKLIVLYTSLIIALVVFLLIVFNDLVKTTHLRIIKREMIEKLRFIELVFNENPGYTHKGELPDFVDRISKIINLRVTIVDFNGVVLSDSDVDKVKDMDNHLYRPEVQKAIKTGSGQSIRRSNTLKTDMLYNTKKTEFFILRLSKPLTEIDNSLRRIQRLTLLFGLGVIIISGFLVTFISRKITRPIRETLNFARKFSDGNYSMRILNYSNDEIGMLQRSLNRMADTIVDKINSLIFEQNKLEITLESISEGIAVISKNKKIIISNTAFNSFFETNLENISRKDSLKKIEAISSSDEHRLYFEVVRSRSLNAKIEKSLSTGSAQFFEEELVSGRYCYAYINPIKEEKTLQGILLVLQDITEKKKIEQMKTDLVGNMSHELKTPITIMKGYLETINENIKNEKMTKEYIGKAIANADRQNSIINDILKLNMLETSLDFQEEDINLNEIIEGCINILKPKAANKGISIENHIEEPLDILKGNRFLAEEIFFNIIDNAIIYNIEDGSINISAEIDKNEMVITIKDSGIGIPKDSIDRIFERFFRVNQSRSRSSGGTGLGLSIVKHAAELLNWRIELSSNNEGSAFKIII